MHKLYRFSCSVLQILSLLFTGILLLGSFLFTCYAENMTTQEVLTVPDNPLLNLLGMGILTGIVLLAGRFAAPSAHASRRKTILLVLVMGWILALGGVLVLFGRTAPAADAWSVYSAAESLAEGDTSVIHPTDSYLSYYPQQVGLLAFFELLIRIWNMFHIDLEAYHFIKCLYILLTCIIVWFQYKAVHLLWENDRADCIYLLLAAANLPLIMYSSFVYGEIPSFAAMSAGIYFLLRILKPSGAYGDLPRDAQPDLTTDSPTGFSADSRPNLPVGLAADLQSSLSPTSQTNARPDWLAFILSLLFLTLSVMLRKNSLILIIAIVLVACLEALHKKSGMLLAYCLLCVVLSMSILPITQRAYELRAGNFLKTGVPAMSYFAMGMQESSRGNGWYNGYNFNTYQDNDMDTEATVAISRSYISERGAYFRKHPAYAASFYLGKFLSQWADGTYASRQATLATLGERHPIMQAVYDGAYSPFYISFCNVYQLVVYLGCFLFFLHGLLARKPLTLYTALGLIGAFGGFLFHMIWEANARYIFLYGLLLLPYTAMGLAQLSFNNTSVPGRFRKNNTRRKPDAS